MRLRTQSLLLLVRFKLHLSSTQTIQEVGLGCWTGSCVENLAVDLGISG